MMLARLETLRDDVRDAVRALVKNPGFTAVALLTLAVGVGANTAIFSVLHAVVLREFPYHQADRLAVLWTLDLAQHVRDGSSYLNVRDWQAESRTVEDIGVYHRWEFTRGTITGGASTERVHLAFVDAGFFRVLGTPALLGRTFDARDFATGHRPIVLSHHLWRQRFGADHSVVGRSLVVNGSRCDIVGVMPAGFTFPSADVGLWLPISLLPRWERLQHDPRTRAADALGVVGRLRATATFDAARAELDGIATRLRTAYPDANAARGIEIEPLIDHLLGSRTASGLWLLLGAVGFVLLIACANVANLALARGATRHTEISLRAALGASRPRLVRQAFTESLVLAGLAAGAGLLLAWLAAAALRAWAAGALPRLDTIRLDISVLLFGLGAALTCGVLAGLLPAWQLSALNPADALREAGSRTLGSRHSRRLRQGLVIAEIALAVVLLSGAGLLLRSFARLQATDRGFDSRHVLVLQVDLPDEYDSPARSAAYFRDALTRIRAVPGVAGAGAVTDFFIARNPDLRITIDGRPAAPPGSSAPPLLRDSVIPGYFEALGVPLVKGRLLRDSDLDPGAPRVVVINETMARRFWPDTDPIGKRLKAGLNPRPETPWTTVVGIVADMKRQKLDEPSIPYMFEPGVSDSMDVAVRTVGDPHALRDTIRAELRALAPAAPPYGMVAAEQRLGATVALRTLQTLLLAALAAAALVLAIVGIYGLVHQSVVARMQEIGIRMALGAGRPTVLRMILTHAVGLAVIGLAIGLIGALALSRTIAAFLYDTSPLDPLIHASVAALLLVVTIAACLGPARRATRVDPLVALRAE